MICSNEKSLWTVKTDHAALKWLLNLKDSTGRLMRWSILLQDYDFTILHRAGNKHNNADALSRLIEVSCLSKDLEPEESQDNEAAKEEQPSVINSIVMSMRSQHKRPKAVEEPQRRLPLKSRRTKVTRQEMNNAEYNTLYDTLHQRIKEEQRKDKALQAIFKRFDGSKTTNV